MLVSLGSIGLGLMWGWLLVLALRMPVKRPFVTAVVLLSATGAVASMPFLFSGGPSLIRFIVAAALAAYAHKVWLRRLSQQKN